MSAEADDAAHSGVVPQQIVPAPTGASPVTPEVLKMMMGGPKRTPLQDTVHKASMVWFLGRSFPPSPGQVTQDQTPPRRKSTIWKPVAWVSTGLTVAGYVSVHFDWIPFPN